MGLATISGIVLSLFFILIDKIGISNKFEDEELDTSSSSNNLKSVA